MKGLTVLVVVLLVFQLGVYVGFRKAGFSYRWADNYHRLFGGPRNGFMRDFPREFSGRDFMSAHGVVGAVVTISNESLVIRGTDDVEKNVRVTKDTVIKRGRETITASDLLASDRIVVLGSPREDGSIEAKMIRLFEDTFDAFPPPPGFGFSRPFRR